MAKRRNTNRKTALFSLRVASLSACTHIIVLADQLPRVIIQVRNLSRRVPSSTATAPVPLSCLRHRGQAVGALFDRRSGRRSRRRHGCGGSRRGQKESYGELRVADGGLVHLTPEAGQLQTRKRHKAKSRAKVNRFQKQFGPGSDHESSRTRVKVATIVRSNTFRDSKKRKCPPENDCSRESWGVSLCSKRASRRASDNTEDTPPGNERSPRAATLHRIIFRCWPSDGEKITLEKLPAIPAPCRRCVLR